MAILYLRFIWRILHHKWWILFYEIKIGGIPLWRLIVHDWTKFSRAEFKPRFRYQIQKVIGKESAEWKACVDHHHRHNAHHWQYWVRNGIAQPIPETYVREMIVDWLAADKTYCDGITSWLREEFPKMNLHQETVQLMKSILVSQGIHLSDWHEPRCLTT
ncbi:MAG: DUF5662 family protein [bacterium]|nr:DUF5662 family protein [bacterium]